MAEINLIWIISYAMKTSGKINIIMLGILFFASFVSAQENDVFLRDDFNDLKQWEPLFFEKIKEHTVYEIENTIYRYHQ